MIARFWWLPMAAGMSVCVHAAENESPSAIMPVNLVNIKVASEHQQYATDVITPFGRTFVRRPEMVIEGRDWTTGLKHAQASLVVSDMNFATTPEWPDREVFQTAVMLTRGRGDLVAGPDVFVFDTEGVARAVTVRPLYRTADKEIHAGADEHYDSPASERLEVGGRKVWGVGIDVDQWVATCRVPQDAEIVGVEIVHDGKGGRFAPLKIMLAEQEMLESFTTSGGAHVGVFGGVAAAGGAGASNPAGASTFSSSSGRGGGGGGGGPGTSDEPDPSASTQAVPAPGPAFMLMAAAGALGLARKRAA